MAITVSPFTSACPAFKRLISSISLLLGQMAPLIITLSFSFINGNLAERYSSVNVEVLHFRYLSHFSRIVRIPKRISATGRRNVSGKKLLLLASSKRT
jgi:hypothetical protein